jgi:hypothetical protein
VGLVVLGVLSVIDLIGPLTTDGEHPPMAVALVGTVLGLISLALVVSAWRGARRAIMPLVILRALSALAAVPAFFVDDAPGGVKAVVGVAVAVTLAGIAAVMGGRRTAVGRLS